MSRKNRYKRQPLPPMVKPEPVAFVAQAGEPEWMPTYGIDRQIAQARRDMGPKRWAELQAEWA